MKNLWHLVQKDLRRFWPLFVAAAALWAAILGYSLDFYGVPDQRANAPSVILMPLLNMGRWILIFVIPVVIIQEDIVTGDRAAWLTRPIRPGTLLASKLIVFVLGLIGPAAILSSTAAWYLGAPGGSIFAAAATTAGLVLYFSLFGGLLAACTRTLFWAVATLFGIFVGGVVITLWQLSRWHLFPHRIWPWDSPFHLSNGATQFIVGAVAVLAVLGALRDLYCMRRTVRAIGLGLAILWAGLVLSKYWPWDFFAPAVDVTFPALNPAKIAVHAIAPARATKSRVSDDIVVRIPLHLDGLPSDTYVIMGVPQFKLFGMDGREISGVEHMLGTTDMLPALDSALRLPPSTARAQPLDATLSLSSKVFDEVRGQTVRAEGEIQLMPFHYRIVHRIPLTPGVSNRMPGEKWRVGVPVPGARGAWDVAVEFIRIQNSWLVDQGIVSDGVELALVNLDRNEVSVGGEYSSVRNNQIDAMHMGQMTKTFRERRPLEGGSAIQGIDADWIRHAELYVLKAIRSHPVEVPFVADRIALPSEVWGVEGNVNSVSATVEIP